MKNIFDISNIQRISWQLDGKTAVWRLGSLIDLHDNSPYYKVIFKKYI
jgi:hypothetical protein